MFYSSVCHNLKYLRRIYLINILEIYDTRDNLGTHWTKLCGDSYNEKKLTEFADNCSHKTEDLLMSQNGN